MILLCPATSALALLWIAVYPNAAAHSNTESLTTLQVDSSKVLLTIAVDADRMLQQVGANQPDGTRWTSADIAEYEESALDYLLANYSLKTEGRVWPVMERTLEAVVGPDLFTGTERVVELIASYRLEQISGDRPVQAEHNLFVDNESFHANVFRLDLAGQSESWAMVPGVPLEIMVEDPTAAGTRRRMLRFAALGSQQWRTIVLAVLFLAVAGAGVSRRGAIVTGFLIATAITFLAVAEGFLQPTEKATQWALGFSILYIAAENLFSPDRRLRSLSATLFGLVHGLGLANGLLLLRPPLLARTRCEFAFWLGTALCIGAGWLLLALLLRKMPATRGTAWIGNSLAVALGLALTVL